MDFRQLTTRSISIQNSTFTGKLMDDNDELTGAIVDCLNALDLDSNIRSEVQDRILTKIISGGSSIKVFPVLITFLLTDCKSQTLMQTILKIRNAIDVLMLSSDKSQGNDSYKTLIFHKLQTLTVSSKNISEAWLNMISAIKTASDHKPVDYLLLFMLHHTVPFKKKIVEAIFKKRVQMGFLKINQLEKMFDKYLFEQLMKDNFNSIVELGCSLIRSSSELCTRQFSTTMFKLIFKHPYTDRFHRRDILDNLIVLAGANNEKTVSAVLNILSCFLEDKEKMQQHTISLMRLLEKLDSLELKHVKQIFDILCSLTCGQDADESMLAMRDEIHMIVRKQLYSTKRGVKHRGIISAIVMARHIVKISGEQDACIPDPITNVNDLPHGAIREAGTILELAYACTLSCPELTGLYYDELTSMLMSNNHLDKYFMSWLYETIHEGFENSYVTQSVPDKINHIDMSMQYRINKISETATTIGINIGGLTLRKDQKIILLAPHFRLLRIINYRLNEGHLDGVNALLGCPIIMPDIDIDDLDTDQAKEISDCLFHCINWFRELISAFVTQKNKDIRLKVIKRLNNLLEMESKLSECMLNIPDHKLPISYFDLSESHKQFTSPPKFAKTKNPKKRLKSTADASETANVSTALSQQSKKKITMKINSGPQSMVFREMDTDVALLIKYPLTFSDDEISPTSSQNFVLKIDHLKFVLEDFVTKLDILSHEKDIGLRHLHFVTPLDLIKDGSILLPFLESHLKVLINKIQELLETTDRRLELPEMFTEEAIEIKTCFGLILRAYYLIFSWTGFQYSSNLEVLKDLLKSIRPEKSQTLNSAHRLIVEFITTISNLHEYCLELSQGVTLVETMEALYLTTTPNTETRKKIVSIAEKLLSKRWYNTKGSLDIGKNANLNIAVLVKAYLSSANAKTISGLVGTLQQQADKLHAKEDYLHMLPSINKQNFHIFFNGLCTALLQRVKVEVQALTNSGHLALWKTTTITMQGLMSVAKAQETKVNLITFLKKCIGILKVFLSDGIPVLELILRSKPDDVVDIFKTMQTTTRFLHHLCCYSKFTKDSSLMAFVPKFRLTLETLVYRVKAALAANNCSSAFWMGNLKNRDLQGEDILSQSTTITETNEENSEDELPDDDDDSDIESTSHDIISENNGSASSEVFD